MEYYIIDQGTSANQYIIDETNSGLTTVELLSRPVFDGLNIGTGSTSIYAGKSGHSLTFKTLKAGDNISITSTDNTITITSTASGSTGGGSVVYTGASPTNVTVGALTAGSAIANESLSSIIERMVVTYLSPAFASFSVSGQATTVEIGTTLSGSKTFTWSTTNSGNVQANSIVMRDVTAGADLATGLANDGSESHSITTIQLNSDGAGQSWRGQGTNTNSIGFNSGNFTVTSRYIRFFGPSASSPSNSAAVRALSSSAFQTSASNNFVLNTGNAQTKFVVALPPGRTISSVIDLDALNANITSQYILTGTVSVQDAGGTNRTYNIYEMNAGAPYSTSHQHSITTA